MKRVGESTLHLFREKHLFYLKENYPSLLDKNRLLKSKSWKPANWFICNWKIKYFVFQLNTTILCSRLYTADFPIIITILFFISCARCTSFQIFLFFKTVLFSFEFQLHKGSSFTLIGISLFNLGMSWKSFEIFFSSKHFFSCKYQLRYMNSLMTIGIEKAAVIHSLIHVH